MTKDVWTPVTTPTEEEDATQEVRVRVADLSITKTTNTGYWKFETDYENLNF
jgi:hypothetical protein